MKAIDRLYEYFETKGIKPTNLEKEIGISNGYFGTQRRRSADLGESILNKVIDYCLDLDPEWLLTGRGSWKKDDNSLKEPASEYGNKMRILPIIVDESNKERIPLVKSKAAAGYIGRFNEPEFISNLPTYSLPGMINATYRMFEITGHSMRPTIEAEDIVVASYIERITDIKKDRIHVIITDDDILIKRTIVRIDEEKLICKSDNAEQGYPPIVLDFEDVREIWYVKMNMTRQFPNPTDLHQRIANLEADVAMLNELFWKNLKK